MEGAGGPEETLSPCHEDSEVGEGTDKSQFSAHDFETHSKFPIDHPSWNYISRISGQS